MVYKLLIYFYLNSKYNGGTNMNLFLNENISIDDNLKLMAIVNEDVLLREELGLTKLYKNSEDFRNIGMKWASSHNGNIYAIIYNNEAIGVVSLSSIDKHKQSSNFGFWIKSEYWNTEIEYSAFALLREKAKDVGIKKFKQREFDNTEKRIINSGKLNIEASELII